MSAIDYVIGSRDLLSHVKSLEVLPKPDSDHFPILVKLNAFSQDTHIEECHQIHLNTAGRGYCRAKWTPQLNQTIAQLLTSEYLQGLRSALISDESPELLLEKYSTLTQELQQHLIYKGNTASRQQQPHSKPWFDKDCVNAKKALADAYQAHSASVTPASALKLQEQKRHYKQLLAHKEKEDMKNNWSRLIQAVNSNDSSLFWRITSTSQRKGPPMLDSHISPGAWEEYFQKLYAGTYATCECPSFTTGNLPEWAPVTVAEIKSLVAQLRLGKAPGGDLIPPEAIKNNLDFWAPILASLFTCIDTYGQIPKDWGLAIIVPIYKKGRKDDPANYRPISLLNVISKLYARHLQQKLLDWMEQENILADEQAGFREGRSTIDQCLVLQHFIEKYSSRNTTSLYAAFIDFKTAFDSIPRSKLWGKLESSSIDRRLLHLIRVLHEGTSLKVRCSTQGHLSGAIETGKGVKQGCILAPLLFNFYINSMVDHLSNTEFHPPKLAGRHISVLLYADDAAVLSRTPVGLRRALRALADYCKEDQLELNYQKTKIMTFAKRPRKHCWTIGGHKIEQVPCFTYLGVVFHCTGGRKAHGEYVANNAQRSSAAILRFLRSKGGHYIPAALKLFEAKSIAQLLYGGQLGPFSNFAPLELVQSKFLRSALQVPKCVSNATLRLETGLMNVEARVWVTILNYWLRLSFIPSGLASLTMNDDFQSSWSNAVATKITTIGLSSDLLLNMGYDQAKAVVKQRVADIERQSDLAKAPTFISSESTRYSASTMAYLSSLEVPNHRKAFTLARCHALPSAVLDGRYRKIPFQDRKCPCDAGHIETTEHVLLQCNYYKDIRNDLILPLMRKYPGRSGQFYTSLLLSDTNPATTYGVARFCAAAIRIRQRMSRSTNQN